MRNLFDEIELNVAGRMAVITRDNNWNKLNCKFLISLRFGKIHIDILIWFADNRNRFNLNIHFHIKIYKLFVFIRHYVNGKPCIFLFSQPLQMYVIGNFRNNITFSVLLHDSQYL